MAWIFRHQARAAQWGCILALAAGCSSSPPERRPGEGGEPLTCEATNPGPAPLRLMTRIEYNNTLFDLLGDETRPADAFPAEHQVGGFDNNAKTHAANPLLVEAYSGAAKGIAQRALTELSELAPCADTGQAAACASDFIRGFGERAFRRPLQDDEVEVFEQLFAKTYAPLGYDQAIALLIEAFLQSPQFLYRVEAPLAPTAQTGAVQLGSYEMASRLSYFLWNSMPDATLFEAAKADALRDPAEIEAQTRRMLEHPRAREMVADFTRQWLGLDRLRSAARDVSDDLGVTADALGEDWNASLQRFVEHVVWEEDGSVETLFSSPTLFVNERLATLYGATPPEAPNDFVRVDVQSNRAGLLTQPGLMALLAHADQSSPIQRGVFVREHILCDPVQAPPPNVDNNPPDPDPNLTTRERFKVHTEEPVCGACHRLIDPIGFGFENYDQLGRFRTQENGNPIDVSGEIVESPDASLDGPFDGPLELAQRLATSDQVKRCVATHFYRYAMGRLETEADTCSLDEAKEAFIASEGSFEELLVALTLTDAFLYRPPLPEDG